MTLLPIMAQAASSFDVEAATRAYLNTLSGPARAQSDAYFEGGYWLLLWNALVGILIAWLFLRFGWSARWRDWAERLGKRRWLVPALYAVPFVVASFLIQLPWTIYTDFIREKQYGLMNQSFAGWAGQGLIALAVSVVTTMILLHIIFAVIRRSPRRWWLWGAGAMTLFVAIGVMIGPVFIAPLFNTYKPMPASPLRDRILALAHANHIPADNVYVFDASKQSKRISANVSGLGPTIRVSLNDNLLNRTSPAEVAAVMGHEMGHYVLNHIPRLVAEFAALFVVGFFLLWRISPRILARYGERWGVRDVTDPAVTPLFVILATALALVLTPVTHSIIRVEENEADAFGLDAAREPDGFASTAIKLSEYRKLEPSRLEEIVFFDHPSGETRVRRAMQWKADHMAGALPARE